MTSSTLPLPDGQPVAVDALRNKRSALMDELATYRQERMLLCSSSIRQPTAANNQRSESPFIAPKGSSAANG
jgi:hypothetical protein